MNFSVKVIETSCIVQAYALLGVDDMLGVTISYVYSLAYKTRFHLIFRFLP